MTPPNPDLGPGALRTTTEELDAAGKTRTMTVVTPTGGHPSRPIVLVFHGSAQSGPKFRAFTGGAFDRLATESGAVVAYLDGYQARWNDARVSQNFATRQEGYDDVAFATAAIDFLATRYGGDPGRVFALGYSNGGQLVIRLIHEIPDRLTAVAIMSAAQPEPENFAPDNPQATPVPVVLFHGTKDKWVPYTGGMAKMWGLFPRGLGLSVPDTAAYYAHRNGIVTPATITRLPGQDGHLYAERVDYRQDGHAPVSLYTSHSAGHTVSGTKKAPFVLGRTYLGLDTATEIQHFFGLPASS